MLDTVDVWKHVLQKIKDQQIYDDATYSTWISKSQLVNVHNDLASIVVPFDVHKQMIMSKIQYFQKELADEMNIDTISCNVFLEEEYGKNDNLYVQEQLANEFFENRILSEYNFDNFIVGNNNREASGASTYVCDSPCQFNPLFIFGNSGLGKTHLLHAIGNYIKEKYPDKKVLFMYSSDFVTLQIEAMRNKTVDVINRKFLDYDYILLDDIQRLKQTASQEIFFNLYNKMIDRGIQIVLTSDIHPEELVGIENRLINRFTSGLTVRVDSPEFETAKAILKNQLDARISNRKEASTNEVLAIEEDVIDFIATRFSSDVRKLEGALSKICYHSIMFQTETIDLAFAMDIFKDNPIIQRDEELNTKKIKKAVCDFYGLTKAQIESKSRTKNIANARHIAIYLTRELLEMSFSKIGSEFGNRDHTTVMNSHEKIKKEIKIDKPMKTAVKTIQKNLGV